jgi:sigma-B regulation protein RsbU (phosphoserine phosphatase)
MAVTRTLIKSRAVPGASAGEVLAKVNDDLRAENEATMFVTVFCAMLHIPTGELTYANGGHNPPVLCGDGSSFDFVDMPPGMALGVMPGVSYETRSVRLAPADTVVLYTDGINEALNGKAEEFGDTRLVEALDTAAQRGEKDLVTSLIAAVRTFCGSTPQSDDMTVVALRYRGG